MEKEVAARDLYMAGWSQQEISQVLKVTPKTVSGWAVGNSWKQERNRKDLRKMNSIEQVERLVEYQLKVLSLMTDKMGQDIGEHMTLAELKDSMIHRADADALVKLLSAIKGKELEWDAIIKIVTELLDYADANDPRAAKAFKNVANAFLNDKRQVI